VRSTGAIPGEVGHTTTMAVTPVTPFAALPANHEPTPPAGAELRGKPARGLTQEWKPAFTVVAVLLVAALIIGILLWSSLEFGAADPAADAPIDAAAAPADTTPVAEVPAGAPAAGTAIATITAYDPDGDGVENDADAVLAGADGNSATSWGTVCYSSKYLGGKGGVGLVVSFDGPMQQAVKVDLLTAPYQVAFFATDSETIPATIAEWGPELGPTQFANDTGTVTSPVPPAAARHVLIMLKELGVDGTCTDANPFRGRLGEIALAG
jgi:hypothetical protein